MTPSARPAVLVVDDDPGVLHLLKLMVGREGYAPVPAVNGTEAVAAFVRHRAEVVAVVLDVEMPGWDGPRTLAELRALAPGLPCVFASGQSPRYTNEALAGLGATVVPKPMTLAAMGEALRAACRPV
jgi:two-component system, OmpR family, response regulator